MRRRIIALVVATTSLVLVSFLVPLALVLRTLAADEEVSTAQVQAQDMEPLVTTLDDRNLKLTVDEVNAASSTPVTVFLPDGTVLGVPAAKSQVSNWRRAVSPSAPRSGVASRFSSPLTGCPTARPSSVPSYPTGCCTTASPGRGCCCSASVRSCCCSASP